MRDLIIDSFAGGGGASTGIEMALGRSPDVAINHNAAALALHAANHPDTLHLSENIYHVDPLDHVKGRRIGLAWFSPDCKHFSKAKGGAPVERNIRDLAHVIPHWVERVRKGGGDIDVIIMENVEEFSTWGPLIETPRGLMPDPERKGETFQKWCKKLRSLGGKLERRELRACDYGAPTIRKRLFVIIRFDGRKIVWPEPTHGAPDDPDVISGMKLPWRTAAEIIDWSLPCPSIFDDCETIMARHGLRAVRPLADNTLARVARGMKRYVLDAERPFLVNLTHGARIESLDLPINTVTGAHRGEKALISPTVVNVANSKTTGRGPNAWGPEEPLRTVTGASGLAVVAPHLSAFYGPGNGGDNRSAPVDEPVRTVTTENRHAVIAPHLMTMRNSGKPFNGADEPTHTITAGGAGLSLVAPVLSYAQQGGNNRDVGEPVHTICASAKDQNQVACAFVAQHNGDPRRDGNDAARPGREADEPLSTVTAAGAQQGVVSAYLSHLYTSNTAGGQGDPERPIKTVTAGGGHAAVVTPHLTKLYGKSDGQCADDPLHTVSTRAKAGVVTPFLSAYYGVDQDTPASEPFHTITTKPRFGHVEAAIDAPPFTADMEDRARQVADFMRVHGFWDEREFVTIAIGDALFVIVDIGMRMLTPRELYNAQGFPPDYEIERGADGKVFSKSVQVSCVGNSVSPPVARALVAANCGQLMEMREAAE